MALTRLAAALAVCSSSAEAALVFRADFKGSGGGTGGASDMVTLGGTGVLVPAAGITNTVVGTTPFNGTGGNYLHSTVTAGASLGKLLTTFTFASAASSFASFQGTSVNGFVVLNGAYDIFFRPNTFEAGNSNYFRPVDFISISGTTGLRLIFSGNSGGGLVTEINAGAPAVTGFTDLGGASTNLTKVTLAGGNLTTPGQLYHAGFTISTDATGLITMKMFLQTGTGAINTAVAPLSSASFRLTASVVGTAFTSNPYSMKEFSPHTVANSVDYDSVRIYNSDPGTFPSLNPAPIYSVVHIGNSLSGDLYGKVFPGLAGPYQATQGNGYSWGFQFRGGTSLTYIYSFPNAASTTSGVGLGWVSPSVPGSNLVPWPTSLPNNRWDVVTLQPSYPSDSVTSTLSTDTAAINGMIAAARANPDNALTRFFIYAPWSFPLDYNNLNSYSSLYLSTTLNSPSQSSKLTRDYFTYLLAAVRQTNPTVALIPAGEVHYALDVKMKMLPTQIPGFTSIRDVRRDEYHMNATGQNIAAYTAYAAIFRKSPVGLPYKAFISGADAPYVEVTPSAAALAIIQQTIWDTVNAMAPAAPAPTAAAARRTHGAGGAFDIPVSAIAGTIPPAGQPPVECRSGSTVSVVATFDKPVLTGLAAIGAGSATISGTPVASGNTLTVSLTGVTNVQTLQIKLSSVQASQDGGYLPDAVVSLRVLQGDVNGDGVVNAVDLSGVRNSYGKSAGQVGFDARADLNVDGVVNSVDVSVIRTNYGKHVP